MGRLNKSVTDYMYYIGWYGSCEQECENYKLQVNLTQESVSDEQQDKINAIADSVYVIYEFASSGSTKKWKSGNILALQGFTELKCGHGYLIILKKASEDGEFVEIDNFTSSYAGDENFGHLISECPVIEDDGEDDAEAMVFELENSKIIGFKMRAKLKEEGFLTWDGEDVVSVETETEELIVDGDALVKIKENLGSIKYFELKTFKNMSFDKESCTLMEKEKVFRYPVLEEKVNKGTRQKYIASNITSLYSDFLEEDADGADEKLNEFVGEDGFDIKEIIKKDGDDVPMREKELPVFKQVRDKFTMLVESIDMEEGTDEEESEVKLDRAMTRIRTSRKKVGENRKLFSENVIKDLIVEDDDTKKANFKESMDLLFGELESTPDLSPGVFMETLRSELDKDDGITDKKMSGIKKIDVTKRGGIINHRKEFARKRECGFEAVEEHIGPSFYIPPTQAIAGTVRGNVSDWNQPTYYQTNNIIPAGELAKYSNGETFDAWCAPTSAAIQLEHLINYGGLKKPTNVNDGFDSSNDINPNMQTIAWDSAHGWGNHLIDGSSLRGTPGDELSVPKCEVSDFGWYMDTNGCGQYKFNPGNPVKGTTIDMIWKGLNEFYAHAGWHDLIGVVSGWMGTPFKLGAYPHEYDKDPAAHSDPSSTFKVIMNEINQNRTILASFSSWNLTNSVPGTHLLNMGRSEEEIHYYELGEGESIEELGEVFSVNTENVGASLGHTVVVFGYIQAGSPEDISNGTHDWLLVRDNYHATQRTIAIPYPSAFNSLLATFYVNPRRGVFKQCSAVTNTTTITVSNPTASVAPYYTFTTDEGELDMETFVFERGHEYKFARTDSGHPFNIRTEFSNEVTNAEWTPSQDWIQGKHIESGQSISFTIPKDYEGSLVYQCSAHIAMQGTLNIASSDDFIACTRDIRPCGGEDTYVSRDPKDGCRFPPCGNFDLSEFRKHHEMWKRSRIHDYSYVLTNTHSNLEGLSPLTITVERGLIAKVMNADEDVTDNPGMRLYTIQQMFNMVHSQFHSEIRPEVMEIDYDEDNHFISMIMIDPNAGLNGVEIADEEIGYTITEFDPMIVLDVIEED